MTDYFALFGQPRSPWLDVEELKQAFHTKTLREHPDAQGEADDRRDAEATFSELNEAYQILRDPKRRLHHLLVLEGMEPSAGAGGIPNEIEDIFPVVATITRKCDDLSERLLVTA